MKIGAHLSRQNLGETASKLELTTAQIFLGSPRAWRQRALSTAEGNALKALKMPIFVHSSYLINPASANPLVRANTVQSLQAQLDNCARMGAEGLVVHAGQGGKDSTMEEAIARWQEVLSSVTLSAPIIIENTAGGNTAPGRHLPDFVKLMEALEDFDVEYCIDTCHSWAGGFGLEKLADELQREVGKPAKVVHMNGSKDVRNSGRDRHANLLLGDEQTELSLEFAEELGVPVILETPGEGFLNDVEILKNRFS